MSLSSWLHNIGKFAPIILPLIPAIPAALIPVIVQGIQEAESIEDKDGAAKLNHVISKVASPDPDVNAAVVAGVNSVIAVANAASGRKLAPQTIVWGGLTDGDGGQ